MNAPQRIKYRGWEIVPFVLPTADGRWSVNCEIERADGPELEVFQAVLTVFVNDDKNLAVANACEDARRHIDGIISDPLR
ncbi:hypothetical protein BH11PSE11_BH11PSE11_05360 [soil metagenome]